MTLAEPAPGSSWRVIDEPETTLTVRECVAGRVRWRFDDDEEHAYFGERDVSLAHFHEHSEPAPGSKKKRSNAK